MIVIPSRINEASNDNAADLETLEDIAAPVVPHGAVCAEEGYRLSG